jgi:hypothetical protein
VPPELTTHYVELIAEALSVDELDEMKEIYRAGTVGTCVFVVY